MNRKSPIISIALVLMSLSSHAQTAENDTSEKVVIEIGSFHAPDANSYDYNYARINSFPEIILGQELERASWAEQEIVLFEKEYPHIRVETIDLFQKSNLSSDLASLPSDSVRFSTSLARDVVEFSLLSEEKKNYLVEKEFIIPLDNYLSDPEFDKNSFYDNLWEPATIEKKVWGVPWSCETYVLLINENVLKNAGIEKVPTTWEGLLELGKKEFKKVGGDDRWGIGVVDDNTFWDVSLSYALQLGSTFFEGQHFSLDDPDLLKAVTWYQQCLQHAKKINIDAKTRTRGREAEIMNRENIEKCAITILPSSLAGVVINSLHESRSLNQLPPQKLEYRIEPLPTVDGNAQQIATEIHYLAIRKSTPERERASWEFIKWVMRTNCSINIGVNDRIPGLIFMPGFPCHKNFLKRDDLQASKDKTVKNIDVFWEAQQHVVPLFSENLRGGPMALKYIRDSFSKDMQSGMSPKDSLARIEPQANAMLSSVSPPTPNRSALFK